MDKRITVLILFVVVCSCCADAAIVRSSSQSAGLNNDEELSSRSSQGHHNYPRIIEQFNHRNADGSYEFRYETSDGSARYERGYFTLINHVKSLVVIGYYSYRMPDGRYLTVFYNADHKGYRQTSSITSQTRADLPRSLNIPPIIEDEEDALTTSVYPDFRADIATQRYRS